jgi:hypothetical protein
MLRQLEEMIALNLTLFTDEEYTQLPIVMEGVRRKIADLKARKAQRYYRVEYCLPCVPRGSGVV